VARPCGFRTPAAPPWGRAVTPWAWFVLGVVLVAGLLALTARLNPVAPALILPPRVGLLYRDGRFVRVLEPGRHRLSFLNRDRVVQVSTAEQLATLSPVDVLSRDRFAFRLGLAVTVRVTDPRAYAEAAGLSPIMFPQEVGLDMARLQPLAAAAMQDEAAARDLADLLDDRAGLAAALLARLADALPGAAVERVLLSALTLPPETRRMFTDAERARREGEAALERARAEQASLRALSNAARLLRDHPGLADLRLYQAIEGRRGPTTLVLGRDAVPVPGGEAGSG